MEILTKSLFAAVGLLIIGLLCFFLYAFVHNAKLYGYIKEKNYQRWRELTSIGHFGPGLSNPRRWLSYLYSELDNENEKILQYKDNIRFGLRQSFFTFLGLLVNVVILAVLIIKEG